jgi:hypothetical protein
MAMAIGIFSVGILLLERFWESHDFDEFVSGMADRARELFPGFGR